MQGLAVFAYCFVKFFTATTSAWVFAICANCSSVSDPCNNSSFSKYSLYEDRMKAIDNQEIFTTLKQLKVNSIINAWQNHQYNLILIY